MPYQTLESPSPSGPAQLGRRHFEVPLSQTTLDVRGKTRSNLFAWRGQFSPQFVEAILAAYCDPSSTVLDPFMGSGTVLVEGARRGHTVFGTEVNPAAYSISRLYEFCPLPARDRTAALDKVESVLDRVFGSDLPLLNRTRPESGITLPEAARCASDRWVRVLLEALVVLADDEIQSKVVRLLWRDIRETILSLPFAKKPVQAVLGDARHTGLPSASVDFIVSSPPYINVFNYHHNYRASTESLGWQPLIVARSEIGANRKFRQNRFLTVVQYCIDMAQALREMRRVGTKKFLAVLVLGRESNVHKTPFFNGEIVSTLATKVAGFCAVQKQERLFTNRFGQAIWEDILHLQPTSSAPESDVVATARAIGQTVLRAARDRVPADRRKYLDDALQASADVGPSPVLEPSSIRRDCL